MKKSGYALASALGILFCPQFGSANPTGDGSIPVNHCSSLRLAGSCEPAPLSSEDNMPKDSIKGNRLEITKNLVLPAQSSDADEDICLAEFETSYYQANDRVRVETEIQNAVCEASHGEFSVRVRTIDEAGEAVTQSFAESWSRTSSADVQVRGDYPVADARRLVWARIGVDRNTVCRCD